MSDRRVVLWWAVLCVLSANMCIGADWRPISAEELALKQSKSDPNADAEALFKDVRIENSISGTRQNIVTTYYRIKIFNDRGREKQSNRVIRYDAKYHISDVQARTIHADGTIFDVKKDAIFDKVEIKTGGYKQKVISFALPSVEPGSIIEYRWTRDFGERINRYIPLDVQSEFPVDEVVFHLKPAFSNYAEIPNMLFMRFGCDPQLGRLDAKGFNSLTVRNVPAYYDEPYSPPERSGKQWILVYYQDNEKKDTDKFWASYGREQYNDYAKERIHINGEVKQIAAEVVAKGKTDEEKLNLLAEYCRTNIKSLSGNEITSEEREGFKANNNSADTLRRKVGTDADINFAFIALAQAAGYDARLAEVAGRGSQVFSPAMTSGFFLDGFDAAVLLNDKWKWFDVTQEYAPTGTLGWREQGVYGLIIDPKDSQFVPTPLLSADQTKRQRIALLKLSPEGDLEGDIRELLFGNEAIEWRLSHAKTNAAEREELVREQLKQHFADFEVKDISVAASPNPALPVGVKYHLLVRGYAQRTGKRMFIHPSFFAAGLRPMFSEATRRNTVYFNFPWSEEDSVDIALPEGFQLDHPEAPANIQFAPVGKYVAKMSIVAKTNTLLFRRSMSFGGDEIPMFDAKYYPTIKNIFDQIHTSDDHLVTLKAVEPTPTGGQ